MSRRVAGPITSVQLSLRSAASPRAGGSNKLSALTSIEWRMRGAVNAFEVKPQSRPAPSVVPLSQP
jgi:hypothetical protein